MPKNTYAARLPSSIPDYDTASLTQGSGQLAAAYRTGGCADGTCGGESEVYAAYCKDRVAQRIIKTPVNNALGNWRDITDNDLSVVDSELNLKHVVMEAITLARIYDRCAILPFLKDSAGKAINFKKSINSDEIVGASISHFVLWTGEIETGDIVDKITDEKYGKPKSYKIQDASIDPSRIVFIGEQNCGFMSAMSPYLADYHESRERKRIGVLNNQAIWIECNWDGVAESLRKEFGRDPNWAEVVTQYCNVMRDNLNSKNIAAVKQGDKIHHFEKSNIGDLIDNVRCEMETLSGVSGIPYSMLFGKSASGLANNSDETYSNYNATLYQLRTNEAEPTINALDLIIMRTLGRDYEPGTGWTWNTTQIEESGLLNANNEPDNQEVPE